MAVIEADIKRLIEEEYKEAAFTRLLEPPVEYFWSTENDIDSILKYFPSAIHI